MATRRRKWFQFSLRTAFVIFTAFAVWLGFVVKGAREQQEAVKAIKALGGVVQYDWQADLKRVSKIKGFDFYEGTPKNGSPRGPAWLRRRIGNDFFQNVQTVELHWQPAKSAGLNESTLESLLPHLQRLRTLKQLTIRGSETGFGVQVRVRNALPHCEIFWDDWH